MTYNWGKTYNDKDVVVTSKPHHMCPNCHSPIYDHKPVCGVCFKAGKYPKKFWKTNPDGLNQHKQNKTALDSTY